MKNCTERSDLEAGKTGTIPDYPAVFCGRSERELAGELCVSQNAINKQRGEDFAETEKKILQNLSF